MSFRNPSFHALSAADALDALNATSGGLSEAEAQERLQRFGPNRLPVHTKVHPLTRFLGHFRNGLIYVLLVAAVVTALLGHWIDAAIIAAVVLTNVVIGFLQEGKAEKALEAVRGMLSVHAWVVRDGEKQRVEADRLVPGDIVRLAAGDRVPADLRLLDVADLRVIEASLTGESDAVAKSVEPVAAGAALGDRFCMAYSGTIVAAGGATGVVCATADATEIGRISTMIAEVEEITTPLMGQVAEFGKVLTFVILALAAVVFAAGTLLAGRDAVEAFFAVVGIAVAAIPEGLPAIMTITLAIGVQRMARRNAIIRRLPAVETLGAVTVICSDKTGTLTRSEMMAARVVLAGGTVEASGSGYEPAGELRAPDGSRVDPAGRPDLHRLLVAAAASNEARLRRTDAGWTIEGPPTEGALLTLAAKAGVDAGQMRARWPRLAEVPFSSERKFMATLHEPDRSDAAFAAAGPVAFLKGAPERVLERCDRQLDGGTDKEIDRRWWQQRGEELASDGFRVLAVAQGRLPAGGQKPPEFSEQDVAQGLTLLGLVGITDPPRPEAVDAVRECREAGIRVKMITGDHASTARTIATQMGIGDGVAAVTGAEIEAASDDDLARIAEDVDVFARVSPEHKLRLVTALQRRGRITAMTGDGVNDAPALKKADIGIAMGIKGTEAAKEAAGMVLADDNFASIVNAVEEGRTVYDNLKKALLFILPTNGGEALIIIAAILFGLVLPVTAPQILWVNMVTAVTLALALAFEPMEAEVMKRRPRRPRESLVPASLLFRIAFVSVLMMGVSLGLFAAHHRGDDTLAAARTITVNALVAAEVFYLFSSRLMGASSLSRAGFAATRAVWLAVGGVIGLQMLFTYLRPFQMLFGTAAIGPAEWGLIALAAAGIFAAVEAEKAIARWRERARLRRAADKGRSA